MYIIRQWYSFKFFFRVITDNLLFELTLLTVCSFKKVTNGKTNQVRMSETTILL